MEQETLMMKPKWEGTVSAKIEDVNADQIWMLIKDFFGIYNFFPTLQASYGVQGNNGEVGSIRYCELLPSSPPPSDDDDNGNKPEVHYVKEKITAIDPDQRSLTFEIVEGNIGLYSYVATLKVVVDDDDGCVLEWSFSFDE
ncbi:OLC1v1029098C1 [Oldenlandia corymbosa var. corymbosa]|uniref:OLC1v1029098C1 n=1 Tax=Oldenlandia corymbosa var. corymbosa TaxID=529605 RepID=A0AAV1CG40_OLDCO|nr:OLC1v1029098C1 [Oldenlandia corymbosa var. corymbosa]